MYKLISALGRAVVEFLVALITLIEAPLFLLFNARMFRNDIMYVFWHWSFGHTVLGLDYASRLFFPHRISLLYIPHPGSNEYLPFIFAHNIDPFIYRSMIPFNRFFDAPRYRILRFFVSVIAGCMKRIQVVDFMNVYKTVSLANDTSLIGNEETGAIEKTTDWTGYIRLLRDNIGHPPRLPDNLFAECQAAIIKKHPEFFDKPFVTLLLRRKGEGSKFLSTAIRCAGSHENYAPAVKFLTQNGYNVVGTGETKHKHFKHIPGYYSFEDAHVPEKLLNLFSLTQCKFFIGQHSGPFTLPNSCGILCLICDSMHYRIGTFHQRDIILFKHLRDRQTGKHLSYVDVFKDNQDLAFGCHFKEKHIDVEPNSPEEILEAVKESCAILGERREFTSEDERLCEAFQSLLPKTMAISYAGNRPPLFMLRQMRAQLLPHGKSTKIIPG